jgi:hypothetical protein
MELARWCSHKAGVLSIDSDFFALDEERRLVPRLEATIAQKAGAHVPVLFGDEHVELIDHVREPVDFIVNFDYHMDCRVEFLRGDAPRVPPSSASVFETLLSQSLVNRYIWAVPRSRSAQAALVYSSAFAINAQPLLTRIHCVSAEYACETILDHSTIDLVFVCRSPDYSTPETDAVLRRLRSVAASPGNLRSR